MVYKGARNELPFIFKKCRVSLKIQPYPTISLAEDWRIYMTHLFIQLLHCILKKEQETKEFERTGCHVILSVTANFLHSSSRNYRTEGNRRETRSNS